MATAAAPKAVPKIAAVPDPAPEGEQAVQPKSKKKLVIVLSLVLALAGGGGAAAWYFMGHSKAKPAAEEGAEADAADEAEADADAKTAEKSSEEIKPPVFVVLEPFTVNLQSEAAEQFLQVSMTLQVADQAQVELIKLYMPEVRNRLLLLLSAKTAPEILTLEGKKKLSEEISASMKLPFAPHTEQQAVSNVFFTSFVIQ